MYVYMYKNVYIVMRLNFHLYVKPIYYIKNICSLYLRPIFVYLRHYLYKELGKQLCSITIIL